MRDASVSTHHLLFAIKYYNAFLEKQTRPDGFIQTPPTGAKGHAHLLPHVFPFQISTVGSVSVPGNNDNRSKQEKMVLGSWPPKCANKCFSCRPCMAALVASPNHRNTRSSSYQGDESYYLLAWKCKCENKFFQP
ncbi:hypothetical protein V6N13_144705 [Hibiscus sabdariffa]|uniref:Epidermal patterning factor-like protein n=1 Tax=Hibiscus sabdariffa TaxID=183260 RepID=A0ABR2FLB4_9ROSI